MAYENTKRVYNESIFDNEDLARFIPVCSPVIIDESVGSRNIMYRLGESKLFSYINDHGNISGMKPADVIPRMTVDGQGFTHLTMNMLDKTVIYELFESSHYRITCKKDLRNMIESDSIVMVYSTQFKVPTSMPYIVKATGVKGTTKIYVNVTDFLDINEYGMYNVTNPRNYNGLMAILVAAAIVFQVMVSYKHGLPAQFEDGMILFYASMVEKVINSIVHMDPITRDKVKYLATEFALVQMYGTERGLNMFQNKFRNKYYPKLSNIIMDSIDNSFKEDCFDNLELFINELANNYPSMRGLNIIKVFDKWVRAYGQATMLGLDYLGYHIYTCAMVLMESPLITRPVLEPLMEKARGADMYKSMQNIISAY